MPRRLPITVFLAAAILLRIALALADATPVTADELLRQITSEGSQPVLERLWRNEDRFEQVCHKIESGDPSWLEVARRLRASSDAGMTLSLNYSVARALPANPTSVLKLINHGFTVDDICTSPFIEPEPGVAESYQRRAVAALRSSIPKDLESVGTECLKRIEEPLPTP